LIGRGAVHRREVNSHQYVDFRVGPTCSGRIITEPVLTTVTRLTWSVAIANPP
jgi:hypothetical protein